MLKALAFFLASSRADHVVYSSGRACRGVRIVDLGLELSRRSNGVAGWKAP